jgi:hypothetical protein
MTIFLSHNNGMDGEVVLVGSRPTRCMCNLPIKKEKSLFSNELINVILIHLDFLCTNLGELPCHARHVFLLGYLSLLTSHENPTTFIIFERSLFLLMIMISLFIYDCFFADII